MIDDPYHMAASFYDRYRPRYPIELIDFVLSLVTNRDEYADIGCGTGALLFDLAPQFGWAVGVDVDRSMLQEATTKQQAVDLRNVALIEQKAEEYLSLRRTPLDLVTAGRSIHWMNQPLVIRRIHELLRLGGVLALVGDRVSLWDRPSSPFRTVREVIAKFERTKGRCHVPARGGFASFDLILEHLGRSPFQKYLQWDCAVEYVWDAERVVNYFYSASGFLMWLGRDRNNFEHEATTMLSRLVPEAFHDRIEFGVTFSRRT